MTLSDKEWLEDIGPKIVQFVVKNAPDKENLEVYPYSFYQDDWEPCMCRIRDKDNNTILRYNGYSTLRYWSGSELDRKNIDTILEHYVKCDGYFMINHNKELSPSTPSYWR